MNREAILDTSVLAAYLNGKDNYHRWAKEQLKQWSGVVLTCEVVITETIFLMSRIPNGKENTMKLIETGALEIPFHLNENYRDVVRLIRKYDTVPMSFADACLVRMSELYRSAIVMTLDSDFSLYRRFGNQMIPLATPVPFGQLP